MTASPREPYAGKNGSPRPDADSNHRPRVLVVDDDAGLARLVRTILRSANFEVETASNGEDALEIAETQRPDVIVLDLRMPRVDGLSFFRELRARGDQTPILVASSYGAGNAQRELGAEGAIEKPFDPDALISAVTGLLQPNPVTC